MKTKILIDFDGTIFNTEQLKENLFSLLESAGFTTEEILRGYRDECKDFKFSINGMLGRLSKVRQFDIANARDGVEKIYEKTPKWIFDDLYPFLSKIDRKKYEVSIFTLGDLDFQKKKAESSGIANYFDNIYYTDKQKWDSLAKIVSKDEEFILVDDRPDTISKISSYYVNATALQIYRKEKDIDDPMLKKTGFENVRIRNFNQIFNYLGE